ncbi:hypothetical protein GCM10010833_28730 [Blastomonas aquatica]|uniref:Secreted protein n=1 Tax=Blastomonas aquatica TaxID=1510276 RepID=A0ABQ1JM52_9SPHN|nr:hypothetical protein GCM10010833_28730 [Blastomonas aquatica]
MLAGASTIFCSNPVALTTIVLGSVFSNASPASTVVKAALPIESGIGLGTAAAAEAAVEKAMVLTPSTSDCSVDF